MHACAAGIVSRPRSIFLGLPLGCVGGRSRTERPHGTARGTSPGRASFAAAHARTRSEAPEPGGQAADTGGGARSAQARWCVLRRDLASWALGARLFPHPDGTRPPACAAENQVIIITGARHTPKRVLMGGAASAPRTPMSALAKKKLPRAGHVFVVPRPPHRQHDPHASRRHTLLNDCHAVLGGTLAAASRSDLEHKRYGPPATRCGIPVATP